MSTTEVKEKPKDDLGLSVTIEAKLWAEICSGYDGTNIIHTNAVLSKIFDLCMNVFFGSEVMKDFHPVDGIDLEIHLKER